MPAVAGGTGGRGRWSPPLGVRGWALFCSKQGLGGGSGVVTRGRRHGGGQWRRRRGARRRDDGEGGMDLLELNQREESLCLGFMIRETEEGLELAKLPPDWNKEWEE